MNLWPQRAIVVAQYGCPCRHGRLDIRRGGSLSSGIVGKGDERYERERGEIHLEQWMVNLIA